MDDVNLKGIPIWDGKTFQTPQEDFLVPQQTAEKCLGYSENVLKHAVESVEAFKAALGRNPLN